MNIVLRAITGFVLIATYRWALEIGKLLAQELSSVWGEQITMAVLPVLVAGAIVLFGCVATAIVHLFDRVIRQQ